MGWKPFFVLTQSDFKKMYDNAQQWGSLLPYRATIGGQEYYGVGRYATTKVYYNSPKITHPGGVKTRIKLKIIFIVSANAPVGSESSIGIVFYKNGDTCRDERGYDFHGITITNTYSPSTTVSTFHEFMLEQDNNKISWYIDGNKISDATLESPLASFSIFIMPDQYTGIIVYDISAEYYDQMEDIFNMLYNAMIIIAFVTFGAVIVSMIIRAFRGKKKEEEVR